MAFNLYECVNNTMETVANIAHQKNLELAYYISPEVPEILLGDPGRLRQIILNLLGNGLKFTEKGEVILYLEKKGQSENEVMLQFSISDSGIGIPSEKQKVIFEAFSQADNTTTRRFGGTGLGLSISTQFVKLMGGEIWVESPNPRSSFLGAGSLFNFTASFKLTEPTQKEKVGPDLSVLKGLSMLVVEDNLFFRRILEKTLTNWGIRPTLVPDVQSALTELKKVGTGEQSFSFILLDQGLPDMDGFTLLNHFKDQPHLKESTLMMLAAAGLRGDVARCRELGIAGYLVKPINPKDLQKAIALTLLNRQKAAEKRPFITRFTLRSDEQAEQVPEAPPTNSGLRILLAEDNAVNQKLAFRMLTKMGHEVVLADNGKEALEKWQQESFDIFLTDIQMPVMDGLEAATKVRELEKTRGGHVPIIAVTAHASPEDRQKCLAVGIDEVVTKPFTKRQLSAALKLFSKSEKEG